MMLRGGGDGLGDHLLVVGLWGEELTADLLELANGGGVHDDTAPSAAGAVEDSPYQAEAAAFSGEPADHLHASTCLAEGALDEVGVPDPLVMLDGKRR